MLLIALSQVQIPFTFWLVLVLFVLLIVGISFYFIIRHRKFHTDFVQTLSHAVDECGELQYCNIQNLPDVLSIFEKQEYPLLQEAGKKLEENSKRIYQGKWIGEPKEILQLDKVLNKAQYRSISSELPMQILSFSILVSAVFLLFGLGSSESRSQVMLLAFIPVLSGAIFASVLFFQAYRGKEDIKRGLNLLSERINEKVPVFRELAGTAALIESFFQYDRQMADSITQLSNTVKDLTSHQLSKHLADNVKEVMVNEVVPPMVSATNAVERLTEEVSSRQEDGMHTLAREFTTNLAISMEEKLQPFYEEVSILTKDLFAANKQLEIAMQEMEEYKRQSIDIQDGLRFSLNQLAEARLDWQEDMSVQADALKSLAQTSEQLAKMQDGSEKDMRSSMDILGEKMDNLHNSLYRVTQGLHLENQSNMESVRELRDSSSKTLSDMRQLSAVLVDQSDHILRQSEVLQASLSNLEEGLNYSVQSFSTHLLKGVDETLESFDEGLAELTDRLSNTTAEINDTVGQWASDARMIEEYRYREKLDHDLDKERKQKELLSILGEDENDSAKTRPDARTQAKSREENPNA